MLGFDHAEVGGALLKKWNLPPQICNAVRYQQSPDNAPASDRQAAWLLCLARALVDHHLEPQPQLAEQPIDNARWQANELEPELLEKILQKAEQQYESSKDILLA